jgi:four helix bundle suffix protein
MEDNKRLLKPHGGYRKLLSYHCARAVHDATVLFCERFIDSRSRTHDQMVQAARSGVQNIAEGSMASATSKKTELKLTGVARASLEELKLDYEDFLRQGGLPLWDPGSGQAVAARRKLVKEVTPDKGAIPLSSGPTPEASGPRDPCGILECTPEVAANTLICLIHQASYLLGKQLERLERDFLNDGGFTERMYRERQAARRQ